MKPFEYGSLDSCHVVVLAGGQGTRLYELTAREAKPALPFGYSLRLIDFSLANAVNSGLDTFTVATQYRPATLHRHIHKNWTPHIESTGGVISLACGTATPEGSSFSGTADAVRNSISRIDFFRPKHLLVLAGDHIYQMDYRKIIADHEVSGAGVTIGAVRAPIEEASGFGIIDAKKSGFIRSFVEKPIVPPHIPGDPRYAFASMGIYVFDWTILRDFLVNESGLGRKAADFGHDVIPWFVENRIARVHRLTSPAQGLNVSEPYWRDVGTLDALHTAHMELCSGQGGSLDRPRWPLHVGRLIGGNLPKLGSSDHASENFIGARTIVGRGTLLERTVVMPGAIIPSGVTLRNAIVAPDTILSTGLRAGLGTEDDRFFRQTDNGVTLVTQQMVAAWRASRERRIFPAHLRPRKLSGNPQT